MNLQTYKKEKREELHQRWFLHTKHSTVDSGYEYPEVGEEVAVFLEKIIDDTLAFAEGEVRLKVLREIAVKYGMDFTEEGIKEAFSRLRDNKAVL